MNTMVIIVNSSVLYIWNLFKGDFKCSQHIQIQMVTMGGYECVSYLDCVNFTYIDCVVHLKNHLAQPNIYNFCQSYLK